MRLLTIILVVASLSPGCSKTPSGGSSRASDVTLPSRLATTPSPAAASGNTLTVTLTREGRVVVGRRTLTLDEFGTVVRERAREHGPAGRIARLTCRLRIDRAAVWRHVQWLLTVLAEQKVAHVRFVVLDAGSREVGLAWQMPREWIYGIDEPPLLRILVVRTRVTAAGGIRCGGFASTDPAAFARFLKEAEARVASEQLDGWAGRIGAGGRAPWGACVAAFELLLAAGAEVIDFLGYAIPTATQREADPLPVPRAADRDVGVGGTVVRGAWRGDGRLTIEETEEFEDAEAELPEDDDG